MPAPTCGCEKVSGGSSCAGGEGLDEVGCPAGSLGCPLGLGMLGPA
jgi:hypothetical protein